MKPLDIVLLPPDSWRPVEQDSGRASNRTSERELDRIPATARGSGVATEVRLWDYSPFGMAILAAREGAHALEAAPGDALTVTLDLGDQVLSADCTVENRVLFRGQLRLGLSRRDLPPPPTFEAGISLPPGQGLPGEIRNPVLYGEWCPVHLEALLPEARLVFSTPDPTLMLFKGQRIQMDLHLPSSGESTLAGRIISLGRRGEEILWVLEADRNAARTLGELAEYLVLAYEADPVRLRELGMPARFRKERLEIRFLEERTGRRRMLAYVDGRLSGEAALLFSEEAGDTVHLESLRVVRQEGREEIIDTLVEHAGRALIVSGRHRLTAFQDPTWAPDLAARGFAQPGTPRKGDSPLFLSREAVLVGKGVPTSVWYRVFAALAQDLVEKDFVRLSPWKELVRKTKTALAKLS